MLRKDVDISSNGQGRRCDHYTGGILPLAVAADHPLELDPRRGG